MNIKANINNVFNFFIIKLIQLFGLFLIILSILLILSLITYSPEDPNFIFKNNLNVKNILGVNGSFTSDLIFQSIGLIAFLFPLTLIITGINIIISKKILLILNNLFFSTFYILSGSLFFSTFYEKSFWLTINGNGGFVGKYLIKTKIVNLINSNESFFYFLCIFLIFTFFLFSVNFKFRFIIFIPNLIINFFKKQNKSDKSFETLQKNENNLFNTNSRTQENLPFDQTTKENIIKKKFILPKIDFLNIKNKDDIKNNFENKVDKSLLEKILLDFGIEGNIKKVNHGPVVTLNEFEPAPGVKVSKIINLSEDIARNTSSESARIATIPGSNTIGIEIPNSVRENVYLREIISNTNFARKDFKLPIALGKSISGVPIVGDLSSMPHLLIAGTTGSGKSVCINTIILSLIYKHTPEKCKFILIDPKMLELSTYEGIPHLLCPVVTEAKKATAVLGWVVKEMESRYRLMTKEGVRNIDSYNNNHKLPMPYIVVVVDEMSDLMHVAGKEIEGYIQKLSQMARASGIHIIMATQRPSVDVITGTIKANFPTRISFQVSSKIDSRTILGEQGAEQLLGKGDMLYMSSANRIVRIHAPFVSDNEIEKVNNFIRSQSEPDYIEEILNFTDHKDYKKNDNDETQDDLYDEALKIIRSERKASTSFLQRKLQIGYNRAARIMDMMEENGVVSKANHVGKREVLNE